MTQVPPSSLSHIPDGGLVQAPLTTSWQPAQWTSRSDTGTCPLSFIAGGLSDSGPGLMPSESESEQPEEAPPA
eukprot:2794596-Rhodomonas_salina.1